MGKKNVIVRFRSAMGGFHKGDVSQYVVKLQEEHAAAITHRCAHLSNLAVATHEGAVCTARAVVKLEEILASDRA